MEQEQKYWGSLPAWYFFLAAMGSMMLAICVMADLFGNKLASQYNGWFSLGALLLAGCGSLLLLVELTHKEKAYLVNLRPFQSVMSFGSMIQSAYIGFVVLYGSCFFVAIPWAGIVWLKTILGISVVLLAFLYVAYAGIELGEAKGRSFWHGSALVPLFLLSGITSGAALLMIVLMLLGHGNSEYFLFVSYGTNILLILQFFNLLSYVYGMKHSSAEEARRGAEKLWSGDLQFSFWYAILIFGTLIPVIGNMLFDSVGWYAISVLLILYGALCFRIDFLKAAVRIVLPGEQFSREMSAPEIAEMANLLEKRWQEKSIILGNKVNE